jgi:UDPglucose 6-dehydrogenase|tara:strand:- start:586 stop:1680 length:1095 start_codon:yes stop_codon:yes gene_type:complete
MKSVSIIGVGKLGLCFALNLEKVGYSVDGYDINEDYLSELRNKTFISSEPGVTELLKKSKNLELYSDLEKVLNNDVIFVVVPTPSLPNGKYDHQYIESLKEKLISLGLQKNTKHLIINCTTFPGYCDELQKDLEDYNYTVSYNPEFIAQGTILKDQVNADMVLIGEANPSVGDLIEKIYTDHCTANPRICRMDRVSSEITKLSLNCFLTTKISFANMIGDISNKVGGETSKILEAIGSDSRVGNKYLRWGYGYGGPCFPRDNRALNVFAVENGIDAQISRATDKMNNLHLTYQIEDFMKNNPDMSKSVVFDTITYKPQSTILEESQQLKFALTLEKLGYNVIVNERDSVIDELNKIGINFKNNE